MSRAVLVLVVLTLLSMPLTSTLAQEAPTPIDVGSTRDGPGWVAIRFVDEAGMFNFTVEPVGEYESMYVHWTIVGEGFSAIGGRAAWESDWAGARVDANGERAVEFESGWESRHGGEPDVRYEYRCGVCEERPEVLVREALALVVVGGEVGEWRVGVDSPKGEVIGMTEGADAWYMKGYDFPASWRARIVHGSGGAHVEQGGALSIEADHALVGIFGRTFASSAHLSAQTPGGDQSCPCIIDGTGELYRYSDPSQPRLSGEPGEYTFRFDDVGPSGFSEVYLIAADVVLPPR